MTLNELNIIHLVAKTYRNTESCYDNMMTTETDNAIFIIEREINLKTMDPTKPKDICTCCRDTKSNLIIDSNPNCPEHAISQQLNKS